MAAGERLGAFVLNQWTFGAVIAAAALFFVAGCGSDDDDPEQDALNVVEDAYDSFNNGDVDEWVEIRDRGSAYPSDVDRDALLENERVDTAAQFEAGERYEDIQCESQGEGEWPVADEGNVAGYYITCDASLVGEQGLIVQEAYEWVVQDGDVIAVRSTP